MIDYHPSNQIEATGFDETSFQPTIRAGSRSARIQLSKWNLTFRFGMSCRLIS